MLVQITSSLISLFHTVFASAVWLLMEKTCYFENRNLIAEIVDLFRNESNTQAIFQIKIHLLASGFMGLVSTIAHISRHYRGIRVVAILKMIVLMWALLGLLLMYLTNFKIAKLICFSNEGHKVITGFMGFSLIHFASILWHFNHTKSNRPPKLFTRQLSRPIAPGRLPKEIRPMVDVVAP